MLDWDQDRDESLICLASGRPGGSRHAPCFTKWPSIQIWDSRVSRYGAAHVASSRRSSPKKMLANRAAAGMSSPIEAGMACTRKLTK